jgi:superfamily II DNA/RNA helicase
MDDEDRMRVHTSWQSGEIHVVCATLAFGMGVDKPDVRFVLHHTAPSSLDAYYQQAGRAGRDGNAARCVLFYAFSDVSKLLNYVNESHASKEHLLEVALYATAPTCRRAQLTAHYGERDVVCARACDRCVAAADADTAAATELLDEQVCGQYARVLLAALDNAARVGTMLTLRTLLDVTTRILKPGTAAAADENSNGSSSSNRAVRGRGGRWRRGARGVAGVMRGPTAVRLREGIDSTLARSLSAAQREAVLLHLLKADVVGIHIKRLPRNIKCYVERGSLSASYDAGRLNVVFCIAAVVKRKRATGKRRRASDASKNDAPSKHADRDEIDDDVAHGNDDEHADDDSIREDDDGDVGDDDDSDLVIVKSSTATTAATTGASRAVRSNGSALADDNDADFADTARPTSTRSSNSSSIENKINHSVVRSNTASRARDIGGDDVDDVDDVDDNVPAKRLRQRSGGPTSALMTSSKASALSVTLDTFLRPHAMSSGVLPSHTAMPMSAINDDDDDAQVREAMSRSLRDARTAQPRAVADDEEADFKRALEESMASAAGAADVAPPHIDDDMLDLPRHDKHDTQREREKGTTAPVAQVRL